MIKGKFLLTAVLALFLASCGDDEVSQGADGAEVKFTAGFVPMQTAGADTRLTTNDNCSKCKKHQTEHQDKGRDDRRKRHSHLERFCSNFHTLKPYIPCTGDDNAEPSHGTDRSPH